MPIKRKLSFWEGYQELSFIAGGGKRRFLVAELKFLSIPSKFIWEEAP